MGGKKTKLEEITETALIFLGIKYIYGMPIGPYYADFAIPQYKIDLGRDGHYWHSSDADLEKDKRRDNYMKHNGWITIRLHESEIKDNILGSISKKLLPLLNKKSRPSDNQIAD